MYTLQQASIYVSNIATIQSWYVHVRETDRERERETYTNMMSPIEIDLNF